MWSRFCVKSKKILSELYKTVYCYCVLAGKFEILTKAYQAEYNTAVKYRFKLCEKIVLN